VHVCIGFHGFRFRLRERWRQNFIFTVVRNLWWCCFCKASNTKCVSSGLFLV
jgi:hypothetical protein